MEFERVFIDSDILLDLILGREPFAIYAEQIFGLREINNIELCTSTLVIANAYYLSAKRNGKKTAYTVISELLFEMKLLSVNQEAILFALKGEFDDFEDGIQYNTARENHCNVILTRNLSDYKKSAIPVMTAEHFLKHF